MPIVTITIIIACVILSITAFNSEAVFNKYLFSPYRISRYKEGYRFLSHAFIHADYIHLAMNMFVLYTCGINVEAVFSIVFGKLGFHGLGTLLYIVLYTGGIYASSIADYIKHKNNSYYSSIGASGAVNAVLFSMIVIAPTSEFRLIFLPIPMPAWVFGLLYLAYSYYMNNKNVDNIGHGAHFWGAIFGFVFSVCAFSKFFTDFSHIFNF